MQRGAIYIRVSTEDQTEFSPTAQRKALLAYAKKNDIYIHEHNIYVDEGISGRKADKRPSFMRMIGEAKVKPKPFDVILVHKFDRFARNREDSVVYKSLLRKDCGIKVISITEHLEDDKFSVILEAMLEAMAEYYSLNLAEEVKKGLFEKASRGENIGKPPYGYDLADRKLVVNEEEFPITKLIFDLYLNKNYSLSALCSYLNQNNLKTKTGGKWRNITITYILQNHVYCGYMRYNYRIGGTGKPNDPSEWVLVKSDHTPVIDEATFDKVQKRMEHRSKIYHRRYNEYKARSWLQQILKCKDCGATMTISSSVNYTSFRCAQANIGACNCTKVISTRKIEKAVLETLKNDINRNDLLIEKIRKDEDTRELDILNNELVKIQDKYELLKNAYLAKIDTIEEYKRNKEALIKDEENLINKIETLAANQVEEHPIQTKLRLESYYKLLSDQSLSIPERNKIAKQFIKQINLDLSDKTFDIVYYL